MCSLRLFFLGGSSGIVIMGLLLPMVGLCNCCFVGFGAEGCSSFPFSIVDSNDGTMGSGAT